MRRPRRLLAVLAGVAAPAALLAGCSDSPELQTTEVDVERAFAAAQDPWAAPADITFPTRSYGGANVSRDAGRRTSDYPGLGARAIARLEVEAALAQGWTLTSAECGDDREAVLELARGAGLDDAAVARVAVEDGRADVALRVPHHLDGSWPDASPLDLAETCVAGGEADEPAPEPPFDPYPGDGGEPPLEEFEPWQRDELDSDETALREAVMADPFVSGLGLDLLDVGLDTGDNRRYSGNIVKALTSRGTTPRESVVDVVGRMSGWQPTWASCGRRLAASATLLREVAGTLVTVRLTSAYPGEVEVALGLPIPEVPSLDRHLEGVPPLVDSRCLADGGADALGEGLVLEGVPVGLPQGVQPYLG